MSSRFFEVLTQKNQAWVTHQSEEWFRKSKPDAVKKEIPILPFITISREYGCAGFSLGELLANELNKPGSEPVPWAVYDRLLLEKIHADHGIQKVLLESLTENTKNEITDFFSSFISMRPSQSSLYRKFFAAQRALAHRGYVVLIGRGAVAATRGLEGGFHLRIYASEDWKVKQVMEMQKLESEKEARKMLQKVSRERESFVRKYLRADLNNPSLYDIMINNARYSREDMLEIVLTALSKKGLYRRV